MLTSIQENKTATDWQHRSLKAQFPRTSYIGILRYKTQGSYGLMIKENPKKSQHKILDSVNLCRESRERNSPEQLYQPSNALISKLVGESFCIMLHIFRILCSFFICVNYLHDNTLKIARRLLLHFPHLFLPLLSKFLLSMTVYNFTVFPPNVCQYVTFPST